MTPRIENPADYEFLILDSFFLTENKEGGPAVIFFSNQREEKKNLQGFKERSKLG